MHVFIDILRMYFIKKRQIDISIYSLQTSPSPSSSSCTRPSCASAHVPLPVPTKTDSQVQFESHHHLKSCVDERSSLLFFGTWFHQLGHLRVICLCQCQQRLTLRCNLRVIITLKAVLMKGVLCYFLAPGFISWVISGSSACASANKD